MTLGVIFRWSASVSNACHLLLYLRCYTSLVFHSQPLQIDKVGQLTVLSYLSHQTADVTVYGTTATSQTYQSCLHTLTHSFVIDSMQLLLGCRLSYADERVCCLVEAENGWHAHVRI